jgi:hypothetical protein
MAKREGQAKMSNYHSSNRRKIATATLKLAAIIFIFLAPFVFSGQTQAATTDPDSTPSAYDIHINRNLIATGDELIYGEINIPCASPPADTADQTFVLRILDSTKTHEYGYSLLYNYFTNGYNKNLLAFYFTAAAAPTWGSELTLRISENPSYYSSPLNTDTDVPASDYTTLTATPDNQTDLAGKLVPIIQDIGNANSTALLTVSGSYDVLDGAGEILMRGAIPGIELMAPNLFLVQNLNLDYTNSTWTTAQFDSYEDRFTGTWVGDDMNATATQFGMPTTMIMSFLVTLPLCLGAIVASSIKLRHTDPGLMCCALFMLMTVQMGWLPKAVFATIYQLCGIYIAYLWFYARS